MTSHLDCSFAIDDWATDEAEPLADPAGAGPATGSATVRKTYSGALDATSVAKVLMTQGDGGAAYLAQERVVGTLDGRSGSFVLQHGAHGGGDQEMQQWAFVVVGSGTAELAGLRGTGTIAHERIVLDYELADPG